MPATQAAPEVLAVAGIATAYLRERVRPHPLLAAHLGDAAIAVMGAAGHDDWDEHSPIEFLLLLEPSEREELARALKRAGLWDPARDSRLILRDREAFRRFPGAEIRIQSTPELDAEVKFYGPELLWSLQRCSVLQDPAGRLAAAVGAAKTDFAARLPALRCEHYFHFRRARRDLTPPLTPRRLATLWAMERGAAVRQALRLAFLADGLPFPDDRWLEPFAETETRFGSGIITAVRALVAARESHTVDHASKVLRDRVAFALQQGGVNEPWLEQWWLWPTLHGRETQSL